MRRKTTVEFIKEALLVHGNIYDYSKVNYKNIHTKVIIICPTHGEFYPTPNNFLNKGSKCPYCSGVDKKDTKQFIEKATLIHKGKYDYSKTIYKNVKTKVDIICPNHGKFSQNPRNHLRGQGCSKCSGNNKKTTLEFIQKAISIHGDKYDYSHINYNGIKDRVNIICPKHGEFKQFAELHLSGSGCRKCAKKVSIGEIEVSEFLRSNGYVVSTSRKDIIPPLELDIYLPTLNKAIEFNGKHWHYNEKFFVPGKHGNKSNLCKEKGIKLLHLREDLWITKKDEMKEVIIKFLNS